MASPTSITIGLDGREQTFEAGREVTIGRDDDCDVRTANEYVSRRHAVVRFADGRWQVENLSERSGLFVQGTETTPVVIEGPTEIVLGQPPYGAVATFDLTLAVAADAPAAAPAAPAAAVPEPPAPAPKHAKRRARDTQPAAEAGGMALEVTLGSTVRTFPPGKVITLGRDPGSDVRSRNEYVARTNARIRLRDGVWTVEDTGSNAGLYVGSERRSEVEVAAGGATELWLGAPSYGDRVTLRVVPAEQAAAASPDEAVSSEPPPRRRRATADAPPAAPEIAVSVNGAAARTFPAAEEVVLGRDRDCDVWVENEYVSRRHAALRYDGSAWRLDDTSSTGVYRDGQRISTLAVDGPVELWFGSPVAGIGTRVALAPMVPGTQLPSAPTTGDLTIGRAPDSAVVIPEPAVSWHHALVHRDGGRVVLRDLRSRAGTFVNGARVAEQALAAGDVVRIGSAQLVWDGTAFDRDDTPGGIAIDAASLRRVVEGKRTILDVPAFSVEPNELVALVGGSGSGKSTLLTALAGFQPADEGTVLYNNADLYRQFDALRSSIGYVPQQDIVHRPLTVARVLHYVAQLRLPADMAPQERQARIERVLDIVSLTDQATTRVERLSGGQLKRVSIAVELLAQPRILFLDEPTSGLDPGLDRKLMTTFRDLADNGQTVLVVTHATGNIDVCDKVAFMAPGGLLAYDGPPAEAAAAFGVARFDDIYEEVDERRKRTAPPPRPPAPPRGQYQPPPAARGHQWRQFTTLTRRYAEIVRRDTKFIAVLLLQAPLIGLLLAAVFKHDAFETGTKTAPDFVQTYAFTLALIATWFGVLSSGREICKELPIVRRERMSGIGIVPYIASKVAVLGALVVVQTLVLLSLVVWRVGVPDSSVVRAPFLAMAVTLILTGLASVGFGLVLSALVENEDRATSAIPLLLIPQLVLGGVIFQLDHWSLKIISGLTTVRWSTQALGTIVDVCGHALSGQQLPGSHRSPPYGCVQARLNYDQHAGHVYTAWLALLAMAVVLPVIAGVLVRRRDPHQRH